MTPAGTRIKARHSDRSLAKACRGEMELLKNVFRVKGRAANPRLQRDKTAAPPTARRYRPLQGGGRSGPGPGVVGCTRIVGRLVANIRIDSCLVRI